MEQAAKAELVKVKLWLSSLNMTDDNFGLIHYDFQLGNVLWDEHEQHFNVFDFDDSMYHWFAMDIVTTLKDLLESGRQEEQVAKAESFLKGYRSVLSLDEEMIRLIPWFKRFDQLYVFSRILRALENSDIDNAPQWYDGLKGKLKLINDKTRQEFQHLGKNKMIHWVTPWIIFLYIFTKDR
ncbi:phosphotransferase enzyme family protein [Paenibacillus mesophilus]|uniref:phosphotransferase enzyme family protein n=1 Tax=Paenibacillus mesophilus TaxID=2582849 RepID=UPI00130534C1|nr:phosphotransferase [Paenibacillus mesophilus]